VRLLLSRSFVFSALSAHKIPRYICNFTHSSRCLTPIYLPRCKFTHFNIVAGIRRLFTCLCRRRCHSG
jgi:hypothetical protein